MNKQILKLMTIRIRRAPAQENSHSAEAFAVALKKFNDSS